MQSIANKLVLGTAQFGMDYGITNISGKPGKKKVFKILEMAWRNGVRRFDTAPGYSSENILGEFISANGVQCEVKVMTKIPSLHGSLNYKISLSNYLESSLNNLKSPIDVLFFHKPGDSFRLMEDPHFFENIIKAYPVSTVGVSVYEPQEVEKLLDCHFNLAFQFPFNVLDRRFQLLDMPKGTRYARSIFLQGLLASANSQRPNTILELLNLQEEYHKNLAKLNLDPIRLAVSFVINSNSVDYFLIGVDSEKQLSEILNTKLYNRKNINKIKSTNIEDKWLDIRNWR